MRQLVLSMFVSVDGFIEGPAGEFIGPTWSADLDRWTFDMIDRFDTLLYGRIAWQGMAAYWPRAERSPETPEAQRKLARFMNSARKIVFSRSLLDASAWNNSVVADEGLRQTIAKEKSEAGKDMVIFAGAKFASTAIREGLVDEYSLLTIPMLFGSGSRLFDGGGSRQELRLLESRRMDTGAVLNRYATVR